VLPSFSELSALCLHMAHCAAAKSTEDKKRESDRKTTKRVRFMFLKLRFEITTKINAVKLFYTTSICAYKDRPNSHVAVKHLCCERAHAIDNIPFCFTTKLSTHIGNLIPTEL
jgi:hypothetical protein